MPVHQLFEALKGVWVLPEDVHHLEQIPRDAPLIQLDVASRHSPLICTLARGVTRVAVLGICGSTLGGYICQVDSALAVMVYCVRRLTRPGCRNHDWPASKACEVRRALAICRHCPVVDLVLPST